MRTGEITKLTKFQAAVQKHLRTEGGPSTLLLVAPTGIGKTLAVTADLSDGRRRIVYGVPLRALAGSILDEVRTIRQNPLPVDAVVHHGDARGSRLFSEEVVVTTYDQIVCAVPGLPLSLPLSAGHAVAGALLMSRLILDEVHLAWGISREALTILLGILEFRENLGLQTVVMTATLPENVARLLVEKRPNKRKLIIAGDDETKEDEALLERQQNRNVKIELVKVQSQQADAKQVDLATLIDLLRAKSGKRIYFANTVERLQDLYDRLEGSGFDLNRITVLHNRMPASWRAKAEAVARQRFGNNGHDGDWLLLTNQVAEAGLDISAPFVLSDPAPVDTLVQRAGRCARWFRQGRADGTFAVVSPSKTKLKDWAPQYRQGSVELTLDRLKMLIGENPGAMLDWKAEQRWISEAWSGDKKDDGTKAVETCLQQATFALNLFDRASQQHSPGAIASAFREILSIQVAVIADNSTQFENDLLSKLKSGYDLESSSTRLARGYGLIRDAKKRARVVRYRRDELIVESDPAYLAPGDILLVPPSVAYLHPVKGLCFGNGTRLQIAESQLLPPSPKSEPQLFGSRRQSLWEHTDGVMTRVQDRLFRSGDYRSALLKILRELEPEKDSGDLVGLIGRLAVLATGFHDLGKCGRRWQQRAHEIDPDFAEELIGRTANTERRLGVPHTPPGFFAAVAACSQALGSLPEADHLVRAIALAAARHHSSVLDPSAVPGYEFDPHEASSRFTKQVLDRMNLNIDARSILEAGRIAGTASDVPLMLPNDDLFPIYALVGRAILISDREDAAGKTMEVWREPDNA
jgi:CRISPR-associated endonuclease/helicase Cas3